MNSESKLWVIHGNRPVLWSIPFRVQWERRRAVCVPAMHLSQLQARAVAEQLGKIGKRAGEGWRLTAFVLSRNGSPVAEDVPADEYFSWERLRSPARPHWRPEKEDADRKAFLDKVYQQGVLYPFASRRSEVEWLWHRFCKAAMDWLINEEQPLDLYLVKLHNWPWRLDWKQFLKRNAWQYGLTSKLRRRVMGASPSEREILGSEALHRDMLSGRFFHMIDSRICSRFLELEHTRGWWRLIKRVEQQRWEMLKAEGYAETFVGTAKRQWPRAARQLRGWLANSLHPSVEILKSGDGGRYRFAPRVRGVVLNRKLRGDREDALAAHAKAIRGARRRKSGQAVIPLHDLPDIRPEAEDVREGGGGVL